MRPPLTEAERQLACRHLRLVDVVVATVFRTRPETVLYGADDARQDARIALLAAAQDYRPDQGASFATFASYRLTGAVLDGLRRIDTLSRTDRVKLKAQRQHVAAGGTVAPGEEIVRPVVRSLYDLAPDGERTYLELLADTGCEEPDVSACGELLALVARLPARELHAARRVWLDGALHETVAAELGVCDSRVSQLLAQARRRLRARLAEAA